MTERLAASKLGMLSVRMVAIGDRIGSGSAKHERIGGCAEAIYAWHDLRLGKKEAHAPRHVVSLGVFSEWGS